MQLCYPQKVIDYIKKKKQALLFSRKIYNLGAPGHGFLITPTFLQPRGTSKEPYLESSNILP